jgi:beta-glucosidase
MAPSAFANANIKEIVEKLTTDESIQLIAGVGLWKTYAVDRLGIPAIKVRVHTFLDAKRVFSV